MTITTAIEIAEESNAAAIKDSRFGGKLVSLQP